MDVISRIVLQAQGGDQAAREIGKVKNAFDEAGKSAKQVAAGVGGAAADPFAAATSKALPSPRVVGGGASPTPGFEKDPMEGARQRTQQHEALTGLPFQRGAAVATGMATSVSQGDVAGTAAGGLAGIAGIAGAAAPWLLGAAILAKGTGALAVGEKESVHQLWQSGMAQRMGLGYTSLRNQLLAMARNPAGVPSEKLTGLTQALGAAGGRMTGQFFPMAQRMTNWGVDPSAMGQTMATMQRLGFQGGVSENTMGVLGGAFGVGRIGPAMQSVGAILENAMARGADRAGTMLSKGTLGIATRLAAFQGGGFSLEGATQLYEQMDQTAAGTSRLKTPMDVMTFRAMRKPGEPMFETLLRMEGGKGGSTEDTQIAEYQMLKERFGGNLNMVKMVLMRGRNLTAIQAEAYVGVREGLVSPPAPEARPPLDPFAAGVTRMEQYKVLEKANRRAMEVMLATFNMFLGTGEGGGGGGVGVEAAAKAMGRAGVLPTAAVKTQQTLYLELGAATMTGNQEEANRILKLIQQSMQSIDNKIDSVVSDEGTTE